MSSEQNSSLKAEEDPNQDVGSNSTPGTAGAEAEKKLAHYKRLIVQSRQMLENYQKQVADKEKALLYAKQESSDLLEKIKQLEAQQKKTLDSSSSSSSNLGAGSGGSSVANNSMKLPLRARRRVNDSEDGSIWILFDYDDDKVEWRRFSDDVSVCVCVWEISLVFHCFCFFLVFVVLSPDLTKI
jgi:hypothetical protein